MIFAAGQFDAVGKRKLLVAVFQVRRERGDLPEKMERPSVAFEARRVPPAREPLEQFGIGQDQRVRVPQGGIAVGVGQPLDEFPVGGGKQFLLVRGADDEVNQLAQRAGLFPGARAQQKKLHGETVARRLGFVRLHAADDAERGARGVEQRQRGWRQPVFEFLDEALLLFVLLGPGKTVGAGMHLQFRRHGTFGAQKQKCQLLQPRPALGVQQPRPPVRVGKILPGQRKSFEIILEQQPRTLGIGTGRETFQNVLALVDRRLGVGEFAAQIREGAIGLRQHLVVRVVLRRAHSRAISISD